MVILTSYLPNSYNQYGARMETMITTFVIQLLFFVGISTLLVGIPYLIMRYFMLRKFNTSSLNYILSNAVMTTSGLRLNDNTSNKKQDKILLAINNLPANASYKQVRHVTEKACGYIPKYKLIITSLIVSPAMYALIMFLCIFFGDEYFLGFFILIGFVCAAPAVASIIFKKIKQQTPVVNAQIEENVLLIQNLIN